MKTYPFILTRIAGGDISDFLQLEMKESINHLNGLIKIIDKIDNLKNIISDNLYDLIRKYNGSPIQKKILNCKRDIYNLKKLDSVNLYYEYLTEPIIKDLQILIELIKDKESLESNYENTYNIEILESRNKLKSLLDNSQFMNGLVLSSHSLLERIQSYLKQSLSDKQSSHVEISLMKYLARFYCKTSPFSTFTNLILGKSISDNTSNNLILNKTFDYSLRSKFRINNLLFINIFSLLTKYKTSKSKLFIKLNESILDCNTEWKYLVNNYNLEIFQYIEKKSEIETLLKFLNNNANDYTLQDLINIIHQMKEFSEYEPEDISEFLDKLIEYGMVEYDIGIPFTDLDWPSKLSDYIISNFSQDRLLITLFESINSLRDLCDKFNTKDYNFRLFNLNDCFEKLKTAYFNIHEAAGLPIEEREYSVSKGISVKRTDENGAFLVYSKTIFILNPQNIIYEDTYFKDLIEFNNSLIDDVSNNLNELYNNFKMFDYSLEDKLKMNNYFIKKYSEDTEIDILNFYEEYYKEYKRDEIANYETNYKNEDKIKELHNKENEQNEELKNLREKRAKWLKDFNKLISSSVEISNCSSINIDQELFDQINDNQSVTNSGIISFGAMIQFYLDDNNILNTVINSPFSGFGKMFSRFMYLFDDVATEKLIEMNENSIKDVLLAEINDSSVFNGNIHPNLMKYELTIPGANKSLPKSRQLSYKDINVIYDKSKKIIQLFDNYRKKKVEVFNLGFLVSSHRSQFFNLLEKFTPSLYLNHDIIVNEIYNSIQPTLYDFKGLKENVYVYPRIKFNGNLVLRRKVWFLDPSNIIKQFQNKKKSIIYKNIYLWKESLSIPDEVFIKKINNNDTMEKPQYISFKNPFLVELFLKLCNSCKNIRIEEMLPNSNQLMQLGNKKRVLEYVLQWYN